MKRAFLAILGTFVIYSCTTKNDPTPQSSNHNPGGGTNDSVYFTQATQDFDCNELYENVKNFKGHDFKLTYGLCPSADEIKYRQFFCGQNTGNPYVTAVGCSGGISKYSSHFQQYEYTTLDLKMIKDSIALHGSFKINQVGYPNPAWNEIDTTVQYGFYLQPNGYDPDLDENYGCWSTNEPLGEFYYEIKTIKRVYPKSVSSTPDYVITGSKNILLRGYKSSVAYHDTLTSDFKVILTVNE